MRIVTLCRDQAKKKSGLFICGIFEKSKGPHACAWAEPALAGLLKSLEARGRFQGKTGETFSSYADSYRQAEEMLLFGLGPVGKYGPAVLREVIGQCVAAAKARRVEGLRLALDSFCGGKIDFKQAARWIAETAVLAGYDFDVYRSKKDEDGKDPKKIELQILTGDKRQVLIAGKIAETAEKIAQGTNFARDLVNEPANVMNPAMLSKRAVAMARVNGLSCKILDEAELKSLKMHGILAVNQGSTTPPALIILEYGAASKNARTVCLIGKGVTFDTGGISIKPSKDMDKMKYDMAGAAAVIAVMQNLARLKPSLHVVALIPAVENNVAKNPQRPGDIIRMHSGKTVEVLNTDAEGRLILADALSYADRYHPKAVIDIATLTGMCAYTFGDKASGLMGNDAGLIRRVLASGEETGERCWELPLWDDYAKSIKGHHSDLYNIGGPYGGTITAAMFLREFVPPKTAWAHLDIAGTAWCETSRTDCPKGATGVGVRLLTHLLTRWK